MDVESAAQWLSERQVKTVGLQLPDSKLKDAKWLPEELQARAGAEQVVVIAGASCSDCCVDEVAAKHAGVGAVVHFGPACFTPTQSLPVFHCLDNLPLLVPEEELTNSAASAASSLSYTALENSLAFVAVLVQPELGTAIPKRIADAVSTFSRACPVHVGGLESAASDPVARTPAAAHESWHASQSCPVCSVEVGGMVLYVPVEDNGHYTDSDKLLQKAAIIFVGEAGSALVSRIALEHNAQPLFRVDPQTGEVVEDAKAEVGTQKELVRRIAKVQKLKDAGTMGTLVSAPGAAASADAADRVRSLASACGKSCYTVVTGRPTPEKLANFPEVEVFVQLACWRSALLQPLGECLQPVLAPFEAELALRDTSSTADWDGVYRLVARTDIPERSSEAAEALESHLSSSMALAEADAQSAQALAHRAERAVKLRHDQSDLALRKRTSSVHSAAEHLALKRTYDGIPQDGDAHEQAVAAQPGEFGRAAKYAFEREDTDTHE